MQPQRLIAAGIALVMACGGQSEQAGETEEPAVEAGQEAPAPSPEAPAGTPPAAEPALQAAAGDTSAQGTIRIVGADPFAQPVLHSGSGADVQTVGIQGALKSEIEALSGLEVRVWGRAVDNRPPTPPRAVEVTGYEIVSVNGKRPAVGTVLLRGGIVYLAGRDTTALSGVPADLSARQGAKVWVVGVRESGALRVQTYGIIREPPL